MAFIGVNTSTFRLALFKLAFFVPLFFSKQLKWVFAKLYMHASRRLDFTSLIFA